MLIPNAGQAVVDMRKLRDYYLNPKHDDGKHKDRLFSSILGMVASDAEELRQILLEVVKYSSVEVLSAISNAKLLDVVALTVDLPQYNLWRGQVGTVVETLANGAAFEVEFSDRDGRTYESVGLRPEQIMVLHFEPASPDIKSKMVTA